MSMKIPYCKFEVCMYNNDSITCSQGFIIIIIIIITVVSR